MTITTTTTTTTMMTPTMITYLPVVGITHRDWYDMIECLSFSIISLYDPWLDLTDIDIRSEIIYGFRYESIPQHHLPEYAQESRLS